MGKPRKWKFGILQSARCVVDGYRTAPMDTRAWHVATLRDVKRCIAEVQEQMQERKESLDRLERLRYDLS